MEFLSFHEQPVSDLPADNQDNHLYVRFLYIVQDAEIAKPKFEGGQWIGAKPFYRFGRRRGSIRKAAEDTCFHYPLLRAVNDRSWDSAFSVIVM
jgi:hypothetical protein